MRRTVPGRVLCLIARGARADDASQAQELAVADRACNQVCPCNLPDESKRLGALEKVQTALHLWVKILLELSVKY